MIQGCLMGLMASIIAYIRYNILLKKCLVEENVENVTVFEFKGKTYDRNKYIELMTKSIQADGLKKKDLEKRLAKLESELDRDQNYDMDLALIESYQRVLEKM